MNKLSELIANRKKAQADYKEALDAEHEAIREVLKVGPHGTLTALIEPTGYSRQHLDRIRRGKTSG